jgi:hypothetical protein
VLPFVVCNSLPYKTSVGASVIRFNLIPVLTLCPLDGSSEGIAGFLISFRLRVPHLESGSATLQLSANVACNPWLLVGVCTYSHCGDDVLDALIDKAIDLWGLLINAIGRIPEHVPVCDRKTVRVTGVSFFLRNQEDRIVVRCTKWRARESFARVSVCRVQVV